MRNGSLKAGATPEFGPPSKRGLYDPAFEKESCGIGFICDVKGRATHKILQDARRINCSMAHRGGQGYEKHSGDGAGILTTLPHLLLTTIARDELGVQLPAPGLYSAGLVFLPQDPRQRAHCKKVFEHCVATQGQKLLGWRPTPIDPDGADIGKAARRSMPAIEHLLVAAGSELSTSRFERQLYIARKHATHLLRGDPGLDERKLFYVCSLSAKIIIYKGMLTPEQLFPFFPDLLNTAYESHLAMVHSRFSTNTFPSWDRAQPNRFTSHNGEINTLLGNRNSMNAREGLVSSPLFGADITKLFPIVEEDCSDSGTFDNVLEFLFMSGYSLQEAAMMMIPEAWQGNPNMPAAKRAFYEYNSCRMEPWDGPASIAFTDGHYLGAVLDRNGLRPSRYYLTADDKCIMASEVGVLPVAPEMIIAKGRLQPGRMFLIDFTAGRMITDTELKTVIAGRKPYAQWLAEQRLTLSGLAVPNASHGFDLDYLQPRMRAFGYTVETMQFMLEPMVRELRDPLGSMGNDAALAALSEQPRLLYDYFKQLFAQVTNPAIDSIREEAIMAMDTYIGTEGNLLATEAASAHRLHMPHPILANGELAALKHINERGWRCRTLDTTVSRAADDASFLAALDRLCAAAADAIDHGYSLLVLSDRNVGPNLIPIPALLAIGAVHHHLNRLHVRTRIGILVETGEAREVHHHCLLIGFGADGINPYLALAALRQAQLDGKFKTCPHLQSADDLVKAYRKAVTKGLFKVIAKMGISTLHSYKGAQIFEAVGLADKVMERCFAGTPSRLGGLDFATLWAETRRRHEQGYPVRELVQTPGLSNDGQFHWRYGGERHMWTPTIISALQVAARTNSEEAYEHFAQQSDDNATRHCTIRGLLKFRPGKPIPLDRVESETQIVKRFATGAMSYGSISIESHETLAIAMNRIGGKSNTGEGGEDPERFTPLPNGDSKRSAIKQVASGRFGVTIHYLANSDELQIKIVQGAKPGEGGELPGHKVDEIIAKVRHAIPGVGLISPPPHHDVYSIEDIEQLIHDLKNANPEARISVKLGAEIGVGTVAAGVVKARADHLTIAGHDGGTGASPLTSIKHAGLPWELGIAETHQTLVLNNLRSRVVLQTDGQLKTGRDVVIACLLGAEEFGFATAPLVALGCIMMRKCHLNTCPVGIATQDPELRRKFTGEPGHLINYFFLVAKQMRKIMARLGFRTVNEMVGRVDVLDADATARHWKSAGLELSNLLTRAEEPEGCLGLYARHPQNHHLENALDHHLIRLAKPALTEGKKVHINLPIKNVNRVVGTMLSHRIVREMGAQMLPDDTIHIKLTGSAGQSLGAWLAKGVTLEVEGDANDYVGKGLSGGRIIIYPPAGSSFVPEDNVLIGNVALYGATSGEAYFRGLAAERFGVRNSGAHAVVEGVGDHGCEYMTGGRILVLGKTGRNFAAGMSGGIAYVWDRGGTFADHCNMEMVEFEALQDPREIEEVRNLIRNHHKYTGSTVAAEVLEHWPVRRLQFIKVMPTDYRRVLADAVRPQKAVVA